MMRIGWKAARRTASLLVAATAIAATGPVPRHAAAETLFVYAAASLTDAVTDLATLCGRRDDVKMSFASSSVLAKQIEHGAPAHVYVSANTAWMDYLETRDLLEPGSGRSLAGNRLVAIVPAASPWAGSVNIRDAIAHAGEESRIALADPDHVPAGMYAKEALEHLGAWEAVEGRVARSPTVRAALALVETGATPLGIVYRTDAAASRRVRTIVTFPPESHARIRYTAAIVRGAATPSVRRFHACLFGESARAVLARHGFAVSVSSAHADTH